MNKNFQPTATDIASYVQVVDRSRKGKVTVEDLEAFITKYFYNPNRNWFVKYKLNSFTLFYISFLFSPLIERAVY